MRMSLLVSPRSTYFTPEPVAAASSSFCSSLLSSFPSRPALSSPPTVLLPLLFSSHRPAPEGPNFHLSSLDGPGARLRTPRGPQKTEHMSLGPLIVVGFGVVAAAVVVVVVVVVVGDGEGGARTTHPLA